MPNRKKQRERQRANRKKYKQEERLGAKTVGGVNDPTPAAAVMQIMREDRNAARK